MKFNQFVELVKAQAEKQEIPIEQLEIDWIDISFPTTDSVEIYIEIDIYDSNWHVRVQDTHC